MSDEATTTKPKYRDAKATWSHWVERFWFLRGVATAILLASLAPSFTDLSRIEILRFFYALVFGWNKLVTRIGEAIGELFSIPPIDPVALNALFFALSLGIPSAYYMFKSRWNAAMLDAIFGTKTAVLDADIRASRTPMGKFADVASAIVFGFAYFYLYLSVARAPAIDPTFGYWAVVGPLLLFHAGAFALAAWKLPGYGKGLVFVVTLVATMQLLYFLQLPWVSDAVRDTTRWLLS